MSTPIFPPPWEEQGPGGDGEEDPESPEEEGVKALPWSAWGGRLRQGRDATTRVCKGPLSVHSSGLRQNWF